MKLIVGLGNIGKEYENTYHNAGFDVVDAFLKKNFITTTKSKYNSIFFEGKINGEKVIIAKPTTFMNNSGIAVKKLQNKFKVENKDTLIVYDDVDIPIGTFRMRLNGSGGTHNGMKNVIEHTGNDVLRLRIGTKTDTKLDLLTFVLTKVDKDNRQKLNQAIEESLIELDNFLGGN